MSKKDMTFDLVGLQTMGGGLLEPLRCDIPASEALAVLVAEQTKALRAEHGPGVVLFLRPSGDDPAARIAELEAQLGVEAALTVKQQVRWERLATLYSEEAIRRMEWQERAEQAEASAAALQQALWDESRRLWGLAEKAKAEGNTDAYRACAASAELWHAAANTAQTVLKNDAGAALLAELVAARAAAEKLAGAIAQIAAVESVIDLDGPDAEQLRSYMISGRVGLICEGCRQTQRLADEALHTWQMTNKKEATHGR